MRYLKLFEAFDSIKLSRVFSYLSTEGKNKFLRDLKQLCNHLDYPLSKLSDDDFQYLRFKKAWEMNNPNAESLEMVKFWFDKDGNYIDKTLIDYRSSSFDVSDKLPSNNMNDYIKISDNLDIYEVKELETGQLVFLDCGSSSGPGYIYKSGGYTFVLQNFASGSTPYDYVNDNSWREIARNSWIIDGRNDYDIIYEIKYKGDLNKSDNFNFNLSFDISGDERMNYHINDEIESKSHFALVLDIKKLDDISLEEIRSDRQSRKKGAFLTDEEIKSKNIERYFNEIFKDEKIMSDPNRVVKRILIGKDILFFYHLLNIKSRLYNVSENYYNTITYNDNYYLRELKSRFFTFIKSYEQVKDSVRNNITSIKSELKSGKELDIPMDSSHYLEFIEKLEELSKIIYDKLSSIKVENVYDIEMLYEKVKTLSDVLGRSSNHFMAADSILSYINGDYFKIELFKYYHVDSIKKFNEIGFNRLKELIKRL